MKIRARGLFAGLMLAAVALAATATVDPNRYLNDIKFLASPELRGRSTGSPELEKAAAFLERLSAHVGSWFGRTRAMRVVAWDQIDIGDPKRPRLLVAAAALPRLGDDEADRLRDS